VHWGSIGNFLDMGGYAFYVWTAYGVCSAVFVAELVLTRARRRAATDEVQRAAMTGRAA
jgi:heme exporter protein D